MELEEVHKGSTQAAMHFTQVNSDPDGTQVWLKVIRKEDALRSEWDLAKDELEIHRLASGLPHVVPILLSDSDDEQIAIAMPRADGGDLWEKIQYGGLTLSEGEAKRFALQLFHGLAELHRARIVHADIKPQNILLMQQGDRLSVALCDFGLSRRLPSKPGRKIRYSEIRGTPGYIAPEVCAEQDYDEKIDVFAAALVVFRLVAGIEPFYPFENFTEEVEFPDDCCGHLSEECKDFIQSMLHLDPEHRLSAQEALGHAWLSSEFVDEEVESENELGLRFYYERELKQEPQELVHAPEKSAGIEEFSVSKQLSHSLSASTICPQDIESDDSVEGNGDRA